MALRYDPNSFEKVPISERRRFIRKCEWLSANRQRLTHTLLRYDLNTLLKWEFGVYRILYTYDSDSDDLIIRLIAHRRDVYKLATGLDD